MKKAMLIWIVFIFVVVLTGLVFADPDEVTALRAELAKANAEIHDLKYGNVPPIEQQIKPAPDFWKGAYGDTQETQLYFNSRTAMLEIEQCKGAIRLIAATINTITDPADPNSLASRIGQTEKIIGELPLKYSTLDDPDNTIIGAIIMHTSAIDQFREQIEINTVGITVLEEKVADMPVIERLDGLPFGLNTVDSNKAIKPTGLFCMNDTDENCGMPSIECFKHPALKPDDPKEVAK